MFPNEITNPLAFEPIFIERIWGGRRLESEFHKKLPPRKRIGESWEIVDRSEAQSVVAAGRYAGKLCTICGHNTGRKSLGKFTTLHVFRCSSKFSMPMRSSLQVHPPERVASRLGGEPKSEFWYVAAADPTPTYSWDFVSRSRAMRLRKRCAKERRSTTFIELAFVGRRRFPPGRACSRHRSRQFDNRSSTE